MFSLPKIELEILDFWKKNKIFQKSLKKESPKGEFVFYEGPPTANGRPGLHHVIARAFKDLICRYKTMQGFHVTRKAGWDTHGLPVEIEVEKEIGIKGKPDIEKYGIEAFNKKCRESVWRYKEEWEKLTDRIGFWLDLEHPYISYENKYIETVWWILKQAWDANLVYRGYKVVPHCPRCGTSLSSHELALGYETVTEPSVFVQFRVTKGNELVEPGDYILSWTTTPWTLPGNVALAVGPTIDYVRIKKSGEHYILAKALVGSVITGAYTTEAEFNGAQLEGVAYEPLYDIAAINASGKKAHYVTTADFVTVEEGTGVVHTAVMYGEDDFTLGLKKDLPFVPLLDLSGIFNEKAPTSLQKMNFKEAEEMILLELVEKRFFFDKKDYTHSYPYCWRCKNPLMYFAKNSWFIKMTALSERLLANAATVNWYPEHIKRGRFGEWVEGVKDWAISRERYWGTPLPFWQCEKCQTYRCLGSFKELPKKLSDVHRPYIDAVTLPCDCGGVMRRVPEVLDTWFDSGSMPFAQYHYPFENKELIDGGKAYPADYIAEGIDQTRGWFYTLLAISTVLDRGASYKNVICLGLINDAEGRKMSKSKGNVVDPWYIAEKFGADALRYHFFTVNQPGETKLFNEKNVLDVSRQVIGTLMNVLTFYKLYATTSDTTPKPSGHILDLWIVSLLQELVQQVTRDLERYAVLEAGRALGDFIQQLSVWYVRRSRERFKDEETRPEAVATLRYVLEELSKVMAPFMPFAAEYVWKELGAKEAESVHLAEWPEFGEHLHDPELLKKMLAARKLVEEVHASRAAKGIKLRQPLPKLEITAALDKEFLDVIADEVNVKKVVVVQKVSEGPDVVVSRTRTSALSTAVNDELKAEGALRELVRMTNALRKQKGLTPSDRVAIVYYTESKFLRDAVIEKYLEQLRRQTAASSWTAHARKPAGAETVRVNNKEISIAF